jgi:hypothetical protein
VFVVSALCFLLASLLPSDILLFAEALGQLSDFHLALLFAARHLHICSCRSRFFVLKQPSQKLGKGNQQPTINSLYQQLTDGALLAPDSAAREPHGLALHSCCSLLLLERTPWITGVASAAEAALTASCGLQLGQLKEAVQQQLMVAGKQSAFFLVEALFESLQQLRKYRLYQVGSVWLWVCVAFVNESCLEPCWHVRMVPIDSQEVRWQCSRGT